MCLDTEELSQRSAIYASLADSMVASVIEELSPKDERSKLLREKLAIIQEAQVSAVSAGCAAASNLQLLCRDALLKNFGFQPQVLSSVRTAPFEGDHVVSPEPKVLQNRVRAIRQADRMVGLSVTFAGRHLRCERLPTSSEVLGGSIDVRQRSDCGLHQERGGHEVAHFDAADHTTAQVVRPQDDYVGSRPSARSAQHPGGFHVQSPPDTDHGVDDGHGESTTRVCQVGRATDRLVCDIRQQTTHQVRIAVSGPQGRVDRCHVHALAQLQPAALWFPELMMIYPRKIQSRCSSKVKTYWHQTLGRETGWPKLVTSDCQIYMRGNSPGHPETEGSFQGSCQHDVKVPSGIFTASVRIPLVKIRGVL